MPGVFRYEVGEQRARATVEAVFDGPFNFLDTSNNYGGGSAERRIGAVVRRRGGVPARPPASHCGMGATRHLPSPVLTSDSRFGGPGGHLVNDVLGH
ncbi:hypothetical protein ACFYYP_40550 [Microbispora rosea]|uniref:hypothetical protein n=1 Tax=Microbispora rosea TaxID=58117 RepID=UPI0036B0443B